MTRTDPWLPGWGQWTYRLPKSVEDSMDLGYRLMAEQKRSERLSELLRESARRTVSWWRDFCDAEWGYAQQQNTIHRIEKKLAKEKKRRKTAEKIRDELIYHLDMARHETKAVLERCIHDD